MATELNQPVKDKINEEIEKLFRDQTTMTKEKLKERLDECRKSCSNNHGQGQACPVTSEAKKKLCQVLDVELEKITSTTISKEQVKTALASLTSPGKDRRSPTTELTVQSVLKEELSKLNVHHVSATQARDILREVCQKTQLAQSSSTPKGASVIDDSVKEEFMNDFKAKHGNNKVTAEEVWELIKAFDKKHHEKKPAGEKETDKKPAVEKKWDDVFNEQLKELFGDATKKTLNEQQLEELAKKVQEKFGAECSQHPGKRFCQH